MTQKVSQGRIKPEVEWATIDTVLLDMDGTLLDRHFDDYFWEQYVPEAYGLKNNIPTDEAKKNLLKRYRHEEGTLAWTDLDFWSDELGLDIPALKFRVNELIQVHPYVVDFLKFCRSMGKGLHIVTNAHSKTLEIKMRKTALGDHFDQIVCAEEVGLAKEDPLFWKQLKNIIPYDQSRTLLADDNESVLGSAHQYGIKNLIYVARPSSTLPTIFSENFQSIEYFYELIDTLE
ncbi:MAG: NIF family HAD-type phosphatase [Desulfobulbaceae bacterium]|nr:NIF family HAD-type phosphatase [Desulfobulbaceae bacterium]